jgi:hypothetical protein
VCVYIYVGMIILIHMNLGKNSYKNVWKKTKYKNNQKIHIVFFKKKKKCMKQI